MLGHSDLQGVFLLGLNRPNQGLTADIHLHVDLGSPKYVGYELTKKPTFINIQQDKSGTYNKLAREIYGIPPDWKPDPGDTLTKPSGDKCGAVQYAIMGALMGAAVGYEKDHYAKLALYAAGAGAAGWIVGKILCKFD